MRASQRAYQATKNINNFDNVKLFIFELFRKVCIAKKLQKLYTKTCFLDLYAFCYLCNNWKLFSNTKAKSIDFVIAVEQVIKIEKIGIISILLAKSNIIELHIIILAPKYNFNLISLSQLCKNRIKYYDNLMIITLIKNRKVITEAKREQNLFMFDLANLKKTMSIINS